MNVRSIKNMPMATIALKLRKVGRTGGRLIFGKSLDPLLLHCRCGRQGSSVPWECRSFLPSFSRSAYQGAQGDCRAQPFCVSQYGLHGGKFCRLGLRDLNRVEIAGRKHQQGTDQAEGRGHPERPFEEIRDGFFSADDRPIFP